MYPLDTYQIEMGRPYREALDADDLKKNIGDCEECIVEIKNARVSGQTKSLEREGENERWD